MKTWKSHHSLVDSQCLEIRLNGRDYSTLNKLSLYSGGVIVFLRNNNYSSLLQDLYLSLASHLFKGACRFYLESNITFKSIVIKYARESPIKNYPTIPLIFFSQSHLVRYIYLLMISYGNKWASVFVSLVLCGLKKLIFVTLFLRCWSSRYV